MTPYALIALAAAALVARGTVTQPEPAMPADPAVLDHKAIRIDGSPEQLADVYEGKVVLIVNVASQCGYTRQYKGLEAMYAAHKDEGLVILGFPCNDFGGQEPGSEADVLEFCTSRFGVSFPMFSKVAVLGDDAHPLFLDLREQAEPIGGPIKWNFTKFLVGRDGQVIQRFEPSAEPDGPELTEAIKAALAVSAG
jgi:glutathione peroxidase